MKRGITIIAVLVIAVGLVAGLLSAGCDKVDTSTTVSASSSSTVTSTTSTTLAGGPSTTGWDVTATSVPPADLVGPFEEPAYLDPQPVDLTAIMNLDKAAEVLTNAEMEIIARQSFVAVAQDPAIGAWKFWQVYETARYQGVPVLVTTDSLLNAYHGLFDTLLQRMEETTLFDQAVAMTEALYAAASDQWNSATDATVKEDARLNMAYFSVAGSLLKGADAAPDVVRDEVDAELALIEAAGGPADSPILSYLEDYSQYKPRGHYTRSEQLKRYFKAMMWYGHTAFYINPRGSDLSSEAAASLTRRAILISSSLVGPAREAWKAIYDPTSFMVGRSDDLGVDDMESVLTKVFGTAQPEPDALGDAGKIATVAEELNKLPAPKIMTAANPGADTEGREENQRSFRVMGQRYIPDSYAFQQLVWPYVGEDVPDGKRDLPLGLDVMTVLGSDQAYKIETQDFAQQNYKNWQSQIEKVAGEFAERSADLWPVNLYTGWLEALRHAMAFPDKGAPDFMKTRAWARKSLNTALGSWTELRHDTILYAKQSVTAEGDGGEEVPPLGYVEPYPAFYAKIAELASTLHQGLVGYDLIDAEGESKLQTMVELAQKLAAIAQKELAGEALTDEERGTINSYGGVLEYLEQMNATGQEGQTLSPTAEKSPLAADVHSSYNTDTALEEATGYPLVLVVAFELDGKLQLFVGASYAYYEFTAPLDGRVTDEEWVAALDAGQAPPRPAWTDEWIVVR